MAKTLVDCTRYDMLEILVTEMDNFDSVMESSKLTLPEKKLQMSRSVDKIERLRGFLRGGDDEC